METKVMTELQRNNRATIVTHFASVLVMLTFILLQVTGGISPLSYFLILALIGLAPNVWEFILWKKNKDSGWIKHIGAIGFAVFYTVCLFTATNNMVFVFAIPIIFVVSVYTDIKYLVLINTGTIIESLLVVILGASTGKFGYAGMDSAIIQVVIMIMVGVYSIITTKTLKDNAAQKLEQVERAQEQTKDLLKANSELSDKLSAGITDIHEKMDKLSAASEATRQAMEEVSIGATDTAEHVQNQSLQTEAIQSKVEDVSSVADRIDESMRKTLKALESGNRDVDLLVKEVETSVANGVAVTEKLEALKAYMDEMNSIVELIGGITSQTSLLALNASIEAARAGEAGRGFSVVATEISGMATRTKEATANIAGLIHNVSAAIQEVVVVISEMVSHINEEKQGAANASESFGTIQISTYEIRDNMDNLAESVARLKEANQTIVDSVQNISAISEEVSAHASETMHAEEENAVVMTQIADIMKELVALTGK